MVFMIFFFSIPVTSYGVSFALLQCIEPANKDHLSTKTAFVCTKRWSLWTGFIVVLFSVFSVVNGFTEIKKTPTCKKHME